MPHLQSKCFFFGPIISSVVALHTDLAKPCPAKLWRAANSLSFIVCPAMFNSSSCVCMYVYSLYLLINNITINIIIMCVDAMSCWSVAVAASSLNFLVLFYPPLLFVRFTHSHTQSIHKYTSCNTGMVRFYSSFLFPSLFYFILFSGRGGLRNATCTHTHALTSLQE